MHNKRLRSSPSEGFPRLAYLGPCAGWDGREDFENSQRSARPTRALGPGPVGPGSWAQGPWAQGPWAQGPWAQGPRAQGPWAWAQGPWAHGPMAKGLNFDENLKIFSMIFYYFFDFF